MVDLMPKMLRILSTGASIASAIDKSSAIISSGLSSLTGSPVMIETMCLTQLSMSDSHSKRKLSMPVIKVNFQSVFHVCRVALAHLGTAADYFDIFEREIDRICCTAKQVFFEKDEVLSCQDQLIASEHRGELESFAVTHIFHSQHNCFFRSESEFFCHSCLLYFEILIRSDSCKCRICNNIIVPQISRKSIAAIRAPELFVRSYLASYNESIKNN